jgi:hypothetical protein
MTGAVAAEWLDLPQHAGQHPHQAGRLVRVKALIGGLGDARYPDPGDRDAVQVIEIQDGAVRRVQRLRERGLQDHAARPGGRQPVS